ncbi:MAG: MATE family efflux transporter, partial [Acinetobacter sp.]
MTNSIRTPFIINHAFRKFFVASILISIIVQFNTLVDGVIVSQIVGPDAISAVNISMPILSLTMLMATMICSGASLIMTGEIGNQNYKQVNRLFTMSVISIFVINLALAIVLCLCTSVISHLLTDDEQILSLLNAYLPISFIGCLTLTLQFALAQFVKISGRPGLVTKCMLVASLGNIVLDLLLVIVLDMGMRGAALA